MADDEKTKKKSKLKWVILLLLLLILGGSAGAAWYFLFSGKSTLLSQGGSGETSKPAQTEATGVTQTDGTTVTLPSFLVNLADPLGRRYIKLTMDIEVANPEVVKEVTAQMPKIRDSIIMLLTSKSYADISSMESKLVLKNEILARLNQALGGTKVTRVFFTDIVIQ